MHNNKGQFVAGVTPWNKGTKGLSKANSGSFKKGQFKDNTHPFWKGDKVGYSGIHRWIAKRLGKPTKCAKCNTTDAKRFEWANISGEYKRDFTDWIRLCAKCHANEHENWRVRWHA